MWRKILKEKIEAFVDRCMKKAKIYNDYNHIQSIFWKICSYGYIPMFVAAEIINLIMTYNPKLFMSFGYIIITSNFIGFIYFYLQILRSRWYYTSKNKDSNVLFKFRNLIFLDIMMSLFLQYVKVMSFSYDLQLLALPGLLPRVIFLSCLSQFLYSKIFTRFDLFFMIYILHSFFMPHVLRVLDISAPLFLKHYMDIIMFEFIIISTLLDHKRPKVSHSQRIQIVLIILSLYGVMNGIINHLKIVEKAFNDTNASKVLV